MNNLKKEWKKYKKYRKSKEENKEEMKDKEDKNIEIKDLLSDSAINPLLRSVFEEEIIRGIKKGIEIIRKDTKIEFDSEETSPCSEYEKEYERFKKEYKDLIYLEQEGIIESKEEQLFKNIYFYYLTKIRDRLNSELEDKELRLKWEKYRKYRENEKESKEE